MTELKASMAGNVWKVNVEVGDAVAKGDQVVILESMKMEIPIESSVDGSVKEVKVNEGDFINEGELVVIIESN